MGIAFVLVFTGMMMKRSGLAVLCLPLMLVLAVVVVALGASSSLISAAVQSPPRENVLAIMDKVMAVPGWRERRGDGV